jgi:hypothetical protein
MATPALYIAYLTGTAGISMALFYIGKGVIAGGDVGGMRYDGIYQTAEDGALGSGLISPGPQAG